MRALRSPASVGWAFLLLGLLVVVLGGLPLPDAERIGERTWPVLLFLALAKVAADLLDEIGLFDVVTHRAARVARGRTAALFALHVLVCTVCTMLLSLDTTAVMLTPLAITIARELALDVLPFAFATLWLANTASLLLPVSNLTNLLAHERLDLGALDFAALMWRPQVATLLATVLVLALLFRRSLRGRYAVPSEPVGHDRRAVGLAALATGVFAVLVVAGVVPWLAAAAMLGLLLPARLLVARDVVRRLPGMLPWAMTAFALGLFLLVEAVVRRDPGGLLTALADAATEPHGGLLLAATGAGLANLTNNLPAYLALEPAASSPALTAALLTGVNAAPIVTPWGSLATLLWLQACRARGVDVPWGRLVGGGAALAVLVLVGAVR